MGGSSGGGGGDTTQTQVKELPAWAQPYAEDFLQTGMGAINQPVQPFQGMRVAPMNQSQQVGLSMIKGRALSGAPDETAARQQATATAQGAYLDKNPYATMANPYLSEPYTQYAIDQNAQSMGRGYATGTAAQMDSASARGRAMGGSGYQQAVGQNEMNLGNSIGNMANQYQLAKTGMGVTDVQNQRGLGSQAWQAERDNMMRSIPLGFQGSQLDYANAQNLVNAGGVERNYQQQLLDQVYSDYMTQQNAPFQQIDRAGNLLGMAIGNSGQTTQTTNNNSNPLGQLAGYGLAGYGALNLFNKGG